MLSSSVFPYLSVETIIVVVVEVFVLLDPLFELLAFETAFFDIQLVGLEDTSCKLSD